MLNEEILCMVIYLAIDIAHLMYHDIYMIFYSVYITYKGSIHFDIDKSQKLCSGFWENGVSSSSGRDN